SWESGKRAGVGLRFRLTRNPSITPNLNLLLSPRFHDLRPFLERAVDSQSWSDALPAGVFGWTRMIRVPDYGPMHYPIYVCRFLFFVGMGMLVSTGLAQTTPGASAASASKPCKIVSSTQTRC